MASKSGVIGCVGGMDIPIIRRCSSDLVQGACSVDEDVQVLVTMTGPTPGAWTDPARGAELARSQIERGADVIIQAAGGTGIGVLQAAADAEVLGIRTDSNQNGLHPGYVLTSMRKRVDIAVYDNFTAAREGAWEPGVQVLGLAECGLDGVLDGNKESHITPARQEAAEDAEAAIHTGDERVHDDSNEATGPAQGL